VTEQACRRALQELREWQEVVVGPWLGVQHLEDTEACLGWQLEQQQ